MSLNRYLTTKSNLKLNKLYFSIIDELSFRVKNLYNSALYEIYNHYNLDKQYLNYNSIDKKMKNHETNFSYRKLNAQMSQQTLKKLDILSQIGVSYLAFLLFLIKI